MQYLFCVLRTNRRAAEGGADLYEEKRSVGLGGQMRFTSNIVLTSKTDPDGVGRTPWRLAIYVSPDLGRVQEMIKVVDSFTVYRARVEQLVTFERCPTLEIVLKNVEGIVAPAPAEMECAFTVSSSETSVSGFPKIVEADAPTMSKRGLLVSLEFEDAGHVNIVWGGDTYLCRAQFDAAAQAE